VTQASYPVILVIYYERVKRVMDPVLDLLSVLSLIYLERSLSWGVFNVKR